MLFYTEEKIERLLRDIHPTIYRETYPIERFKFAEGEFPDAHEPDYDDSGWDTFRVMDYWGGYDVMAWFRTTVPIPAHLRGKCLVLRFVVGPRDGGNSTAETLLYVNGEPLQGIDVWHEEAWLPEKFARQDALHIALHAWSGVLGVPDRRRFKVAELNWVDGNAEKFYFAAHTLLKATYELDTNDWRRVDILQGLNDSFQHINFTKPRSDAYYDSLKTALDDLQDHIESLSGREMQKPTVTAIGHSHIDMAWLWRLIHTRQKAGRTFATVLNLMRQYPEYRYMHSSPQLYEYLEQDHPDLFAQVRDRIASGDWEITGGMWIESDINMPNGESLVRQFLYGKRYIKEKFDQQTNVLWLPDVFGYSWALPQIIKGAGIDFFMTTKISWSQFNRFPYDTFRWRGIDGTEILTYFITTPEDNSGFYTYNGNLRPQDIKGIWDAYRQKAINDELLLAFGWGDGGGGPTKEMLEQARVMRDVPGFPKLQMGTTEPFFERLAQRISDQTVPVWDGELYLEYHRGTYTSQAANKRANRLSEILYHDAEWLSAMADAMLEDDEYPTAALAEGWKLILLNQFHDILPGSSIRPVYEDSLQNYAQIARIGEEVRDRALRAIASNIATSTESVVVFNSLSWRRDDLLSLAPDFADKTLQLPDGSVVASQVGVDGDVLVAVRDVPALGYHAFPLVDAVQQQSALHVTRDRLENPHYRIELNERGQIMSIYDKTYRRNVLSDGQAGNRFIAFEDRPMKFDAWDIDLYYQEKPYDVDNLVEATVEETGPLRGTLKLVWQFYDSIITQRLSIYAESRRINFRTHVDWQERQVLLKVAFPVNIRSTRATYDIQFGSVERPTHWNTSWDYARFEVVGHKWADLSETNYGVSLLNDCKYGHDIKDNVMRLTLIKSGINPDPEADRGEHVFTYSLLPHAGDWRDATIPRRAYEMNMPLLAHASAGDGTGTLPATHSFAAVDSDSVVIETVKRAEDERAWVVRLYENQGNRLHNVMLRFGQAIQEAATCNLVEENRETYPSDENRLHFDIAPYEIKTFIVWF